MYMPGSNKTGNMFYGPKRVWLRNKQVPGLAMTRSIGDMAAASVGVTAEPEIKVFNNLQPSDKFLVVASDGIWDRFSNKEVMMIVARQFYAQRDAEGACN
jgi:serine/threonine protein phosphatase PrpC